MIPAMANPGVAPGGVRVPPGSRDWLLPLGDPRALVLRNLGVWLAGISEVRRGFDWPGTRADTHLVLGSIAGSGTLEVAGKNRVLSPGTLVLSPAGLPRRYFTRAARWRLLMVRVADLSRWHHLRDDGVRAFSDPWLTRLRAPMEGMLWVPVGGANAFVISRSPVQFRRVALWKSSVVNNFRDRTKAAINVLTTLVCQGCANFLKRRPHPVNHRGRAMRTVGFSGPRRRSETFGGPRSSPSSTMGGRLPLRGRNSLHRRTTQRHSSRLGITRTHSANAASREAISHG